MDLNDIVSLIKSDQGLASNLKEEMLSEDNKKKLSTGVKEHQKPEWGG